MQKMPVVESGDKEHYVWYVWPEDSHTNEVLTRELPEEESLMRDVTCGADKKRRNLWQCDFSMLSRLANSGRSLGLRFRVYRRRSMSAADVGNRSEKSWAPVEDFTHYFFLFSKRKKKQQATP